MRIKGIPSRILLSILVRPFHVGNKFMENKNVKQENPIPKRDRIRYEFKEIQNESMIKQLSRGLVNPRYLKMPSSLKADQVTYNVVNKLSEIDLSNYEKGKQELKKLGIFGALIPQEYGGLGLNFSQYAYLIQSEKLIDWSLVLIAHQNLCAQTILLYGSEEQKNEYLPKLASGEILGAFCLNEKSSGNDMYSMESEAILGSSEDHYILNGTKTWVINGFFADIFVVFSLSRDSMGEGGRTHMTCVLVDKYNPGVSVGESYDIDWLPNCFICDVSFKHAYIPMEKVLNEEHGGYKIANHVQNNARYIIGACVSGIMRKLNNNLLKLEESGKIPNDKYIKCLMNQCYFDLFVVESCLYFTTRFADNYYSPEIELEGAAVKVCSCEYSLKMLDNYYKILLLIGEPITAEFQNYYNRINAIQNFMGSNFFTKLYIGGTMIQLSVLKHMEFSSRMATPLDSLPYLKKTLKESMHPMVLTKNTGDPAIHNIIKFDLYMIDLKKIFSKIQHVRHLLTDAINDYKDNTLDNQDIIIAMSNVGVIIYVLSCCIARTNTTYGDFEINCTNRLVQDTHGIIDESILVFDYAFQEFQKIFTSVILNDVANVGGYVPINILEMRRELMLKRDATKPWVE